MNWDRHALVKSAAKKVGAVGLAHMTGLKVTNVESYLTTGDAVLGGWRLDELVRAAEWVLNPPATPWQKVSRPAR